MPSSQSEPIGGAIRDHQTTLRDWPYARLASELHRWVEIFELEFKLQFPSYPILKFSPLRNAYATYSWSRNELGTKDNITFNSKELSREPALILRTLCHELLHLWQNYHGKPSKSNYHNVEYRNKAMQCGLIVDPWGCTSGHTEAFTKVLAKYGIYLEPLAAEMSLWETRGREQKMKKWHWNCTTVRWATVLQSNCLRCGEPFVLV